MDLQCTSTMQAITVERTVFKVVEPTHEELAATDCAVILTDHAEFDYRLIDDAARLVVDTRDATWGPSAPDDRVVRL